MSKPLTSIHISRAVYHECRTCLYSQNSFFFTRCGSDLRTILQPRDASRFGEAISPLHTKMPLFHRVIFHLGDNDSPEIGWFKTQCFLAALSGLRHEVRIRNLSVLLGRNCWGADRLPPPPEFSNALRNIKVIDSLRMLGIDKYLLCDTREIPRALAMNIQPVWWKLHPCDLGFDSRGIFESTYLPAKKPEEVSLQAGQILMDAGVEYYATLMVDEFQSDHAMRWGVSTSTNAIAQVPNNS